MRIFQRYAATFLLVRIKKKIDGSIGMIGRIMHFCSIISRLNILHQFFFHFVVYVFLRDAAHNGQAHTDPKVNELDVTILFGFMNSNSRSELLRQIFKISKNLKAQKVLFCFWFLTSYGNTTLFFFSSNQ